MSLPEKYKIIVACTDLVSYSTVYYKHTSIKAYNYCIDFEFDYEHFYNVFNCILNILEYNVFSHKEKYQHFDNHCYGSMQILPFIF